jgi:TonB family protein
MNRLQKKCFVASTGVHLLLALILFVGPVIIASNNKPDDLPILNFVPIKTVDELVAPGGGNPKAQPPPATVPEPPQPEPKADPPAPQPEPVKIPETEPAKEVKPAPPEEVSPEPAKERPTRKIEISTKLVTRPKDSTSEKKAREEAQAREQAQAQADARRRVARQIGRLAEHLGSELSSSTSIELQGPGGGGLPYANFIQAIKTVYDRAWLLPDGVVDDDAVTIATVTIARDGNVITSFISSRSGDHVVDTSVQLALDRVRKTPPLPDNAKENQRTLRIQFSVKAKRQIG